MRDPKEAGYWEGVQALQGAFPRASKGIAEASNFFTAPKTQEMLYDMADGLSNDALTFGDMGFKSVFDIARGKAAKRAIWSAPTYKIVQEGAATAAPVLRKGWNSAMAQLPGTAQHVENLVAKTSSTSRLTPNMALLSLLGAGSGALLDAGLNAGVQVPMMQEAIDHYPSKYLAPALAGGTAGAGVGGAIGGTAAGLLGELAMPLLRTTRFGKKLTPGLEDGLVQGAGMLGGMLGGGAGFQLGEHAGVEVAKKYNPTFADSIRQKLGAKELRPDHQGAIAAMNAAFPTSKVAFLPIGLINSAWNHPWGQMAGASGYGDQYAAAQAYRDSQFQRAMDLQSHQRAMSQWYASQQAPPEASAPAAAVKPTIPKVTPDKSPEDKVMAASKIPAPAATQPTSKTTDPPKLRTA